MLEKEVSAHKKEIKTRDLSIGEKEKKIYELKKKNQELDKFKFVLDFKIRELKHQARLSSWAEGSLLYLSVLMRCLPVIFAVPLPLPLPLLLLPQSINCHHYCHYHSQ